MQSCYDDSMPPTYDDYIDESGFGRVSTLAKNNPTYLENVQSYGIFDKSGFGEVMTLVNVNPTILEECQFSPVSYTHHIPSSKQPPYLPIMAFP